MNIIVIHAKHININHWLHIGVTVFKIKFQLNSIK